MEGAYLYQLSKNLGNFSDVCNMLQKMFSLKFPEIFSTSVTLYIQEDIHPDKLRDHITGYIFVFLSAVDARECASSKGT